MKDLNNKDILFLIDKTMARKSIWALRFFLLYLIVGLFVLLIIGVSLSNETLTFISTVLIILAIILYSNPKLLKKIVN